MITINSMLHSIMIAWKDHLVRFGEYRNLPHSARFNDVSFVTFYYDQRKFKMTIEEIEENSDETV